MTSEQIPHVHLTNRFFEALVYAADAHKDQVRKSTNVTYISHPIGVASLVLEAGGNEDQAIAALLHDVAEDCGGMPRIVEIEQKFGPEVAKIVLDCTDSLAEDSAAKESWEIRKERYIEHLRHAADSSVLVSAADKTHNARAIATDLQELGPVTWQRFTSRNNPGRILWYYQSLEEVFRTRGVSPKLLRPLQTAIQTMQEMGA